VILSGVSLPAGKPGAVTIIASEFNFSVEARPVGLVAASGH